MLLFQSVPPSPLTVSTSLFSMPGSPLLSCTHVLQYCLSRVHMFSLSRVHVQFSLSGVHEFMSSVPQSCLTPVTPWTAARQASLSFTVTKVCLCSCPLHSWYHSAISWCYFLLLPSIILSIRNFSNKSAFHIRWAKYWSFSFIISPSNEYSELISLKIDWFVLLGVQGTLRSLLQHNSSKASIVWCSAFLRSSSHSCVWPLGRPQPWLYRPLSAEQCLCFSTRCLSLLSLSRQAIVFWFHGCTHSPQWF